MFASLWLIFREISFSDWNYSEAFDHCHHVFTPIKCLGGGGDVGIWEVRGHTARINSEQDSKSTLTESILSKSKYLWENLGGLIAWNIELNSI